MSAQPEPAADQSCRSCRHWERFGGEPWGECRAVRDERAEPLRFYLTHDAGGLVTEERHGCRGWQGRGDDQGL